MINSINSLFCYLNLDPKPGQGPSKLEALEEITEEDEMNFESVHNIDEYGTESALTMREALKTWNMTVQWWLVANVYRQLPGMYRVSGLKLWKVIQLWVSEREKDGYF